MTADIDMEKLEKMHEELAGIKKYVNFERSRPKSKVDTVLVTFKTIDSIARRMLVLAEFAEYCLDKCSWDNEPDGGSIQDKAEELGFLELRPIDPEDSIDDETEHYFCKWTPKAAPKGDHPMSAMKMKGGSNA